MNLILDQPIWMLVMALGFVASLVGWGVLRGLPASRRFVVVGARFASFTCFALALAGLQRVETTDRLTVVAVVDTSGSIKGFADLGTDDNGYPIDIAAVSRQFVTSGSAQHEDDDRLGMIAFDGLASVVLPARTINANTENTFDTTPADGTNIAAALSRAQSLIAGDSRGRIVLISDGVSTAGALDQLILNTPVDVVPIEYQVSREVLVHSVEIPTRVAADSLMPVRITLRSTGPANGSLKLIVDGQTVNLSPDTPSGGLPLALKGGIEPISISVPVGSGRVHRVRAVWEPQINAAGAAIGDTNILNNESTALTLTSEHGRALIVTADPDSEATALIQTLESSKWSIDTVRPGEVPTDVLGLEPYDLVVLVNTPRDALMPGIEPALDNYVRTLGGGLLFIGGYEALGAGGWNASLIKSDEEELGLVANLLPVNLEIPDDVVTTHAAVMLVLDSSGSMRRPVMGSSRSQQSVANNSAAGALEVLDPTDMVGVVSFSGGPRLVVPVTKNNEPEIVEGKIKSIASGGGTNLAPALRMAGQQLLGVESKTKHIVVLSDGESQDAEQLPSIARELGAQGIKVSTITIGDEADEKSMRIIATESGGVYYRVVNPAVLPRIFLKAVRVLRRPMVREGVIDPVVVDPASPMLVDSGSIIVPNLSGLVLTEFKSDDPRVMVPIVSTQGEPILAGHQVELGRVAVFTSDTSEWAGDWIGTESFEKFWRHLAQWAGRAADPGVGELSINQSDGGLAIGYTAIDDAGVPIDGLAIQTKVFTEGSTQSIDMVQIGPGQYAAELPSVPSGDHVVVATPKRDGKPIRPTIGAVHIDDQTEFNTLSSDRAALESIARRSGGRVLSLTEPVDLFTRDGLAEVSSYESMWRPMLLLGFILFLIDLGARRVAWDRWIAQARAETIAVSRAIAADQIAAISQRTKQTEPEIHIDLEPVRRQWPQPAKERVEDDAEVEELSSLMAAKKRARERMDDS